MLPAFESSNDRQRRREDLVLCCEYVHHVELYVERQLRGHALTQVESHVLGCVYCLSAVEFELMLKSAVAEHAGFVRFSRTWH